MAPTDVVRDLYLHLLRTAEHVPAALITAAAARANADDESLTLALLRHPDTPPSVAKALAGPARKRTASVWVAYLRRAEHTDTDRVAAISAEKRLPVLRTIAGDGDTPPAVLTALADNAGPDMRVQILDNSATPAATRLDLLARVEQHLLTTVGRHTATERQALTGLHTVLRGSAFDDIAADATMHLTHAGLLLSLATFRTLPHDAVAHVAQHVVIKSLATLPYLADYARAGAIGEAEAGTLQVLRHCPDTPEAAALRAAIVDAWHTATLTDDELRLLRRALPRHGILDVPAPDVTTCAAGDAVAWAAVDKTAAAQLTSTILDALGDNPDAWRIFDTFAGATTGTLGDVLTTVTAAATPAAS